MTMMTFKQFLEAKVSDYSFTPEKTDALIEILKKNCSEALEAYNRYSIYRGIKDPWRPAGVYDPSTGTRESENTTNFYTIILDTNPANDGWPKRSKSFICSLSKETASEYGNLYQVFPFNGVKVASAGTNDIWNTRVRFPKTQIDVRLVAANIFWDLFFPESIPKTMDALLAGLRKQDPALVMDALVTKLKYNRELNDDPAEVVEAFIQDVPLAYSFKNMGCVLSNPNGVRRGTDELWFSGPCVLIPEIEMLPFEIALDL